MTVDIELAINQIQALNRATISTVYAGNATYDANAPHAPDLSAYLTVLDSSNLPYILTWPGPAQFYSKGGGWIVDLEQMLIIGFIEPYGLNDIPSRAVEAIELYQAVRASYAKYAALDLFTPTQAVPYQITIHSSDATPHSTDGLVSDLVFGTRYHGFRLRINVRIQFIPT